jgi:hypothetical protein
LYRKVFSYFFTERCTGCHKNISGGKRQFRCSYKLRYVSVRKERSREKRGPGKREGRGREEGGKREGRGKRDPGIIFFRAWDCGVWYRSKISITVFLASRYGEGKKERREAVEGGGRRYGEGKKERRGVVEGEGMQRK